MIPETAYRKLGRTDISVSTIAFGAWGIGGYPFWESKGDDESIRAIGTALDAGINFFDTAPVYGFGRSEELIGKALKGKRDKAVIATKCGLLWKKEDEKSIHNVLKPASVRQEVENSLRRLNTDRIDLYQIHWPSQTEPPEPALEEMARLKEEGKILAIGVSNFDIDLMKRSVKVTQIDSLQPKYNLLEREAEQELLPFCGDNRIGVIVYSPLASGLLTGKYSSTSKFTDWRGSGRFGIFRKETIEDAYKKVERLKAVAAKTGRAPAELSINWVLANPNVTSALVGVKDAKQVEENVEYLLEPLTKEEKEDVEEAC